jgi:hypothetical protein
LIENDKILLPCTDVLPDYDIGPIDDDDYLSIGWMLGDGWQSIGKNGSTYGVCFGPKEDYAREKVTKNLTDLVNSCIMHKYGVHTKKLDCYKDKNNVYNWASKKKSFIELIKDKYGLYERKAGDKIIPEKIKQSTPNQISSFLSGLFSADGSVYIKKRDDGGYRFYVTLSSVSEQLLYDTQELLRCYGIESRNVYSYVNSKEKYQGHLTIENMESIKRFSKYIDFRLCPEKKIN